MRSTPPRCSSRSWNFCPPTTPAWWARSPPIRRELVVDGLVHRFDPPIRWAASSYPSASSRVPFCRAFSGMPTRSPRRAAARRRKRSCKSANPSPVNSACTRRKSVPRDHTFLGNTPLLFSHVEYARARRGTQRGPRARLPTHIHRKIMSTPTNPESSSSPEPPPASGAPPSRMFRQDRTGPHRPHRPRHRRPGRCQARRGSRRGQGPHLPVRRDRRRRHRGCRRTD